MKLPAPPVAQPLTSFSSVRTTLVFVDSKVHVPLGQAWLDEAVQRTLSDDRAAKTPSLVTVMPDAGNGTLVVVVAIDRIGAQSLRSAAAEAVALLLERSETCCAVVLSALDAADVQLVVEGVLSANHRFQSTGPAKDRRPCLGQVDFIMAGSKAAGSSGLHAGWLSSLAALSARDLATEPGNTLTPPAFVQRCRDLGERAGFGLTVMGRREIEALGMGGLQAVSSGSRFEPFLVRMDWQPDEDGSGRKQPLVLVGKTVTFDSGGLSLTGAVDMDHMKADMGGGAAVFGAMAMIAEARPDFPVTAIFAVADNMPGPDAMRPGDVIRMANGSTVEIINTDAEGRLVLADALHYAAQLRPLAVIDLATLTGASLGIFGPLGIGSFANDDLWFGRLAAADRMAGEKVWRLPLWPEYRNFLRSPVADLRNYSTTGQSGSTPVAAAFLSHFVGEHPWLHLDLYNTCWNDRDIPMMPQGPTGSGARVLAQLILDLDLERTSKLRS